PAPPRLAARAGDALRVPGDGDRHGDLPPLLGPGLPAHARAHGRRHRQPPGGHLRRSRRPGVPPRGRELPQLHRRERPLPLRERADGERGLDLLPVRLAALGGRDGGLLVFDGRLSPGALFAFIGLLSNFFDPVQQLSQFYQTMLAAMAALEKIVEVLETEPAMADAPGARELPQIAGKVEFADVQFAYSATSAEVLHGVSFAAEPGQTVALVGHTGAGKSTVVKLLARFY